MTKQQVIDLIADRLGNRSAMDGRIVMELDASQEYHEQSPFHPWFLAASTTVVATSSVVSLPTDFIAPLEDQELLLDMDSGEPLVSLFDWQVGSLRLQTGRPRYYVLGPTQVALYPAPSEPASLRLSYYARQPLVSSLSAGGTNQWLVFAPLVLANYAGAKIAMHLRGLEVSQLFMSNYQEAVSNLMRLDAAWRQGGKIQLLGG